MKSMYIVLIALVTTYVAADIKQELFDAVHNNNITQVQALLTAEPNLINVQDDGGNTPLHRAVIQGYKELVELLIGLGAHVNAQSTVSWTPLHFAAIHGNKELVELLIASGAHVNAQGKDGMTSLHEAAGNGNKELAKLLIALGAHVNAQDKYGWTPLHWATSRGYKELVELLIASGAQVNAQDSNGRTPLHEATANGHKEVVKLLLEQPAINLDLHNADGQTAFDIAKEGEHLSRDDGASACKYKEIADLIENTSIKRKGKLSEWILQLKKPLSDVVIETTDLEYSKKRKRESDSDKRIVKKLKLGQS